MGRCVVLYKWCVSVGVEGRCGPLSGTVGVEWQRGGLSGTVYVFKNL